MARKPDRSPKNPLGTHALVTPARCVEGALCRVAETSVFSMAVFDREMRYLAVSPEWLRLWKLEAQAIVGRCHYEIFPEIPERWKAVHRRTLAGEALRCEHDLFVRDDGVSHWLRWSTAPWRNEQGAIGGLLLCSDDITENRRLRVSLDASEATAEMLFQNSALGVAIIDANGQYVRANPAFERLLGYPQSELRRMCLGSTIDPDGVESELAGQHRLLHGDLPRRDSVVRHLRSSGEQIWLDQIQTAVIASATSPAHLVLFARDVTEQKAMERRLRETDRLASVGMLGAGLGHDMKSVLLSMRLGLDAHARFAAAHARTGAERRALRPVADGVEYLERISQGLVAFVADPQSTDSRLPRADLLEWWDRARPLLLKAVPLGVSVEMALPPDIPPVSIGVAMLSQAMLNLVVNAGQAIAAHPDPGRRRGCVRIAVSHRPAVGRLRVSVVDDGVGMSEEVRRRAFDAFFTTRAEGGGTGLGLALVKRLVEAAGGVIEVDSEPGRGTAIHLDMPVAEPTVTRRRGARRGRGGAAEAS